MTMMSALATCIAVVQIRILTLELFKYSVPPRIVKMVKFTKKTMKTITCFKDKTDNKVKRLKDSADDVNSNADTSSRQRPTSSEKSADSVDAFARYGNRRFSWLEEEDTLYAGQSTSSGTSTSMSTRTDDHHDLKLQREVTAGSILLSNDNDSDAMFSDDEDDIEQMIKDITSGDNDPDSNNLNTQMSGPENVEANKSVEGDDDIDKMIKDIVAEDNDNDLDKNKQNVKVSEQYNVDANKTNEVDGDIEQMIKDVNAEANDPEPNDEKVQEKVRENGDAGTNKTAEDHSNIEQMIDDITTENNDHSEDKQNAQDLDSQNNDIERTISEEQPAPAITGTQKSNINSEIKDDNNIKSEKEANISKSENSNNKDMTDTETQFTKSKKDAFEASNSNDSAGNASNTQTSEEGISGPSNSENYVEIDNPINSSNNEELRLNEGAVESKQLKEQNGDNTSKSDDNSSAEGDSSKAHRSGRKRVTFKEDEDLVIVDETQPQHEQRENKELQSALKRANTSDFSTQSTDEVFVRPTISKANTISEISLEKANEDQPEGNTQSDANETAKVNKPPIRSTSLMQTKPTLSGNRPQAHVGRSNSRLSRSDSILSNRTMTPDINPHSDNNTRTPFTASSKPFLGEENQPFSVEGRDSKLSLIYPETYADMDYYEWEKDNKQLLGDDNDDVNNEDDPMEDEEEEEEDSVTWEDVVDCSDVYLFLLYLIVTTLITLAFFLPMLLAYT